MSLAPALVLPEGDWGRLGGSGEAVERTVGPTKADPMAHWPRMTSPNAEIARTVWVSPADGDRLARPVRAGGISILEDKPPSGRPPEIDEADVVVATLAYDERPPTRLGITQLEWFRSSRPWPDRTKQQTDWSPLSRE